VNVRKTLGVEVLVFGIDIVVDLILNLGGSKDGRIGVHIESDEEMRDQCKLHDRYSLSGEMQCVLRWLLMPF
jgi:hypothetical protein